MSLAYLSGDAGGTITLTSNTTDTKGFSISCLAVGADGTVKIGTASTIGTVPTITIKAGGAWEEKFQYYDKNTDPVIVMSSNIVYFIKEF